MIEYYKYTDRKCEECNGTIVYDEHHDEYYCLQCGLIEEGVSPFTD